MRRVFSDICPKFSRYFVDCNGLAYQVNDLVDDLARMAFNGYKPVWIYLLYNNPDFVVFLELADIFFDEKDDDG